MSEQEGEHDLASGIVREIDSVPLVLFYGPVHHLSSGDDKEYVCTDNLRHNCEGQPAECLPEVVGAADKVEAPALRDTSLGGTWLSQVAKGDMAHQVQELKHSKDTSKSQSEARSYP